VPAAIFTVWRRTVNGTVNGVLVLAASTHRRLKYPTIDRLDLEARSSPPSRKFCSRCEYVKAWRYGQSGMKLASLVPSPVVQMDYSFGRKLSEKT
jgi:hypothetical protein